ncbi:hypothetical protein ADEAN_000264000 [Angomonas deanei]|uniref:Uncharacterized protein n=1 Tax=Angomonas deanei TaxID=59799 RepID=A0A7G2C6T6_9TRYP|nr:hypothetical protein ADEAN_000264000 [Angomonas deanei]
MGSGSSSNIRLEHQPCPNFLNFMPDNKIIPKATLPLITKHGELVKSATAAIIIPLRPPNEVLENMNIVSEDRKPLSKKQQEEMRQLRGLSSCFLVMYDVSLDGRLAPTAAVAPTAPPTAGGVTVGKGFNFNFVMPKPEPPAPENGKCVVASSGKTTGVAPGFRPPPPGDDDMGGPLSSMASFNGSVKSVLIHQSSFRGKDTGNSVSRGRTQRLAKIKVAQRTHYNIFNDSQTHEAYVTITYYYTASKEEETRLLCEPTKSKMLPVEGVDGTISQPYVEIQPDIPSSVLRKKILENAQLKQESKDLFSQLPDKKGMVNQVTMVLPPGGGGGGGGV